MDGRNSKKNCSSEKKLVLHQTPVLERTLGICAILFFNFLAIWTLFRLDDRIFESILAVVGVASVSVYMICTFRSHITIDFKNNNLIICEFPGITKETISLYQIYEVKFTYDSEKELIETIDILRTNGNTIKIYSWGGPWGLRYLFFNSFSRQIKRLGKFIDQCNEYLNSLHRSGN